MKLICVILLILSGFMESTAEDFKVVGPAAPLFVNPGEDLVLPCSIHPNISAVDMTVEWLRPDLTQANRLVHLYEDHKDRNEDQIESYRGRTGLFKEELHKGNTSLKLSAVQPSDEGVYNCFIESESWYDDITFQVTVNGKGFHAWKISVICISVFGFILFVFIVYMLKVKSSKKQLSPAQCSAIAYLRLHSENVRDEWNLSKYNTSDEGYRRLIPAITNCRKARLTGCNITEEFCRLLTSALQTEKSSLIELDFSYSNLQDSGVKQLSVGLKSSHCKVEIIRLAGCNLTVKSCEYLTSTLQTENPSLKQLDLNNNNLKDSGVEHLSAGLKSSNCKLETLRLAGCNLTVKSCEYLTSTLQTENSSLKQLDLNNNNLKDSGVEHLSDGLKSSNCKLETLRLALCNLGGKSCENLASALQQTNSLLRELDFSNNDLNNLGVEHLSTGHCKLEILRLSGCLVTEEGCSSLASALSSNLSHLKELDLTYNHPGESGVKLLCARLEDRHCKLETLRVEFAGETRINPGLKKYVCVLTLDPNTAHTRLSLSEGNRKVTRVKKQQPYPDHPERFDYWKQVLSRESVLSGESVCGRCYWEAEWSGGGAVIAVTYKGINRKGYSGDCVFGGNIKSWCLFCSNNRYIVCHNNKETVLPAPPSSSNRVGVYLDWTTGTLSFYSVSSDTHTLTHLYTFHSTFTEPLYAGFWLTSDSSVCVN